MDPEFQKYIPADFHPQSRVWIYQCSRIISMQEALQVEDALEQFTDNWKSHGAPVKGYANLFYGQFIVVMADETATQVGGCSTDSSVHVIKSFEQQFGVNFFDRNCLAFIIKDKVQLLPLNQLSYGVENGFIGPDTLYFNNTVQTKGDLLENWIIPVKKSWLVTRINFEKSVPS